MAALVRRPLAEVWTVPVLFVTFRVSRRRREMYCGHARVCVCVCVSAAACPHYCTDPDVAWGSGRGCPLVVHYWTDLQSVHGLRCYGNITRTLPSYYKSSSTPRYDDIVRTRNVSECSVLALCLVVIVVAAAEQRWLSRGQEGELSGLFCAILCATIVHSAMHTHVNRPNSSVNWVLFHMAHFTVLRFISVCVCILCITVYCML